jgi:chromate reductase, NAD(P)H dehydrogenase (quinone)
MNSHVHPDIYNEIMAPSRLLFFPASLRRRSYQRRLLDYFAESLSGSCEIDMLTPEDVNLPLFNQDLEQSESVLSEVIALQARFKAADGFVVASPEYNGHLSPYLKNTVDWVSRLPRIDAHFAKENPFRGKPVLLASASTGWTGGLLGLQSARSVFSYLGCLVTADQICVSDAEQWVVNDRFRFEDAFAEHIRKNLVTFLRVVSDLRPAKTLGNSEHSLV